MSIFTPAVLHRSEDSGERQLDPLVEVERSTLDEPLAHRSCKPPGRLGVTDEQRGRLLRGRLGLDLDAVLGGEIVDQVRRAAGLDQVRGEHRVVDGGKRQPQRFRVVRHDLGVAKERRLGGLPVGDEHSAPVGDGDAATLDRDPDGAMYGLQRSFAPADRLTLERLALLGGHRLVELVDAVEQVAELEPAEHLLQLRPIGGARDERGRIDIEREIAAHRREALRRACLVGVLPHRFPARRGELVGVRDHLLERAVLRDQLPGSLVADARDPRDVVRRIALEPDEVRHLVGPDAVAELDALRRVDVDVGDAARRHHQRHVLGAELEGVAIGRDDARLHSGLVGARRDRGDHVVGLPPLELEVPIAESLHDGPKMRELLAEQIGHRLAALLVDDVHGLRFGSAMDGPCVPGDRNPSRAVVGEKLEEHVPEPEQCVRREAVARRELLRQREERAVGEIVAVDEKQVRAARRPVVEVELRSRDRLRGHAPSL